MAGESSTPKNKTSPSPQKEGPPGDKTALDVNLQELMRQQEEADRAQKRNEGAAGAPERDDDDEKTEGAG